MKKGFEFREWIQAPLEKLTAVQTSLEPVFREPKLLLDAMFQDPKTYLGLNSKLLIGAVVAVGFIPAVKFLSRMLKNYEIEGAKPVEEEASDDQAKIGIKELQHQSDSEMRQEEDSKTTNKSDEDVNGLHEDSAQGERKIILEKTQMAEEEISPELQKEADEPDCDLMEFDEGNGLQKDSTLTEREIILEKTQMAEEETSPELQKKADEPDCDLMESDGGNGLQKDSTLTEREIILEKTQMAEEKTFPKIQKEADEPDCDLMKFDERDGLQKDNTLTEREIILQKTQMAEEKTSPELQKEATGPNCVLMEFDEGYGLQKDSTLTEKETILVKDQMTEELMHDYSFEKAFDLISNHPVVVKLDITRAQCLIRLERYEHAKNILSLMIHTDEDNAEALLEFGFLYASVGKFKLARTNFERAMQLSEKGDPTWERAKVGLNVTQRRGNNHCSLTYIGLRMRATQCCSLKSEQKRIFFRGKAYYHRRKYSMAKECFEQSMSFGIFKDVRIRWAFCCMELGLLEEAVEVFKESPEEHVQALKFMENLLQMTGGRCPYVVLGIPRGTKEDAIRWKYQQLTDGTNSTEELARIQKAFTLLNDRVFRLEYEGLRREMAHLIR
ncbi:uncharacterized protein [Palaemon carinicauda]|uniref:uncharacterized protein n=1 Tax=Palaemon carinicauda TaxID=392227 RepID=UPI0035B57F98